MSNEKPFHNPFAALEGMRGVPSPQNPPSPPAAPLPSGPRPHVARAVVRLERSGRSGKEVTVVDHLGLSDAECHAWVRALRAALGCGGAVEDGRIVLQGDHRKRLPALLSKRGVRRVIAG